MRARALIAILAILVVLISTGSSLALVVKPGTPVPDMSKPFSLVIDEQGNATLTVDGKEAVDEVCNGPGDIMLQDGRGCSLGANFVFSGDVVLGESGQENSDVLRFPRTVIKNINGQNFWITDWAQMFSETEVGAKNEAPADIGLPARLTDYLDATVALTPPIQEANHSPTTYKAGDAIYMIASDGLCEEHAGGPNAPVRGEPLVCPIPEPPPTPLLLFALAATWIAARKVRRGIRPNNKLACHR